MRQARHCPHMRERDPPGSPSDRTPLRELACPPPRPQHRQREGAEPKDKEGGRQGLAAPDDVRLLRAEVRRPARRLLQEDEGPPGPPEGRHVDRPQAARKPGRCIYRPVRHGEGSSARSAADEAASRRGCKVRRPVKRMRQLGLTAINGKGEVANGEIRQCGKNAA
jgi:hypothetical protein